MKFNNWARIVSIGLATAAGAAAFAQTAIEAPGIVQHSIDRGSISPSHESTVTVHLKLHNEAAFNKAVEDLYAPGSPTYHRWMTSADFARYAPTANEIETVKRELQAHGLSIVSVDPNGFSIRAKGTALSLESAFQTQLHAIEHNGETIQANVAPAALRGPAGALVKGVTGLTGINFKPGVKYQFNPVTGKPVKIPLAKAQAVTLADLFTNSCFSPPTTLTLTTSGAINPVGVYYGTRYASAGKICGWTPSQLQVNYGIQVSYGQGIDGTGQTIVVVEGPVVASQLKADVDAFASLTGLPAFTASNYKVIYPDGMPSALALANESFDVEAQLDVEWSHAIAPKANIVVLITPTTDWPEFEYAIQYAVNHKLGNVISNSYGYPEGLFGAYTVAGFDQVLKTAAAAGVAVNFSSGDSGDVGTGVSNGGGESFPASSEYVTSVGGTSIGVPSGTGFAEVGWGNNATVLSLASDSVLDPPVALGFQYGSGGGESVFIAKPSWQKSLAGSGRQQPDIAEVGDPFTGAVIVADGQVGVVGGTSLSCPVFSAIWAMADQKAGASLGQAAPLIVTLSTNASAIKDIVPLSLSTNPSGTIYDSSGQTFYSAISLVPPLFTTTQFISVLWDGSTDASGEYVDVSFGTDTSLKTATGWDNVTGYGVPKGSHFINAAAALK